MPGLRKYPFIAFQKDPHDLGEFSFPAYFCPSGCRSPCKGPWRAFHRGVEIRRFYRDIFAEKLWKSRIFSRRRIGAYRITVVSAEQTFSGAFAPAAWASPGCDDAVLTVLSIAHRFPSRKFRPIGYAPAPLRAGLAKRGPAQIKKRFSRNRCFPETFAAGNELFCKSPISIPDFFGTLE